MKLVELEILMKNGGRQKVFPVWDQYVDDQWIVAESDDQRVAIPKSKIAKAVFSLKEFGENSALY